MFEVAVSSLLLGRIQDPTVGGDASQFLFGEIVGSIGIVLPAIAFYYFRVYRKSKIWIAWIISIPILLILFMLGIRNTLLFAFLGFVIAGKYIDLTHLNKKLFISLGLAAAFLLGVSGFMRNYRVGGLEGGGRDFGNDDKNSSLAVRIARSMSGEGIIKCMNYEKIYFDNNPYTFGTNTGFILYFWIPRALWHDKPTMLGHWLVREEETNVPNAHSSSYGFAGEPYADFGYLSLILIFFYGVGLKKIEVFQKRNFRLSDKKSIMGAMMYPWVFFFVRSPITSTISLLGAFVWYLIFVKLLKKNIKN